jgi:hypothetical protein
MASANILSLKGLAETETLMVHDEWDRKRGRRRVYRKIYIGLPENKIPDLTPPDPGIPAGLTTIDVSNQEGLTTVVWTFESEPEVKEAYFEMDGATSTEPITMHPDIQKIVKKYARGMKDGEVDWLLKNPGSGGGSTGLSTSGGLQDNINPFYGVTDFLRATANASYTQWYGTRGDIPLAVANGVAKISKPDGLQDAEAGQWLCVGARIQQAGDAYRVTRTWMAAAGKGKWNSRLYG